jgi:uncharacterized protein YggU (UPF0235/DUF167 family)/uncharacterized protein YggT (Ycf19 family)
MAVILAQAINIFSQVLVLIILAHIVLSYFMDPYHPVRQFISRLVEPLLAPIRRVVPLVGMFDFSSVILIILVQLIASLLVNLLLGLRWGMSTRKYHLHDGRLGAALAVRVTPRASHNQVTEIMPDGTVKVRLTAPLAEGDGNSALIQFLSEVLGVGPSKIDIIAGTSGKDKLVSVLDIDKDEAHQRLLAYLE